MAYKSLSGKTKANKYSAKLAEREAAKNTTRNQLIHDCREAVLAVRRQEGRR